MQLSKLSNVRFLATDLREICEQISNLDTCLGVTLGGKYQDADFVARVLPAARSALIERKEIIEAQLRDLGVNPAE